MRASYGILAANAVASISSRLMRRLEPPPKSGKSPSHAESLTSHAERLLVHAESLTCHAEPLTCHAESLTCHAESLTSHAISLARARAGRGVAPFRARRCRIWVQTPRYHPEHPTVAQPPPTQRPRGRKLRRRSGRRCLRRPASRTALTTNQPPFLPPLRPLRPLRSTNPPNRPPLCAHHAEQPLLWALLTPFPPSPLAFPKIHVILQHRPAH
jgi:hypothetical protein